MLIKNMNDIWSPPSINDCESAINMLANEWIGRCHEIAVEIKNALKIPGVPQYGIYTGIIHNKSVFKGRPFTRHGWIKLKDGRIFDPTRWVFDRPLTPYIWCEFDHDNEYDIGGLILKRAINGFEPAPSPHTYNDRRDKPYDLMLNKKSIEYLVSIFPEIINKSDNSITLSLGQINWFVHLPHHEMGRYVKSIMKSIRKAGLNHLIPIDTQNVIWPPKSYR